MWNPSQAVSTSQNWFELAVSDQTQPGGEVADETFVCRNQYGLVETRWNQMKPDETRVLVDDDYLDARAMLSARLDLSAGSSLDWL